MLPAYANYRDIFNRPQISSTLKARVVICLAVVFDFSVDWSLCVYETVNKEQNENKLTREIHLKFNLNLKSNFKRNSLNKHSKTSEDLKDLFIFCCPEVNSLKATFFQNQTNETNKNPHLW